MRAFCSSLALLACLSAPAHAEERTEHFEGETADSLEEAFAHLREHNDRLAALIEKDALSAAEMTAIHELSYTLENALQRIDTEVAELGEILEAVHIASEEMDRDTVREQAPAYLEGSEALLAR